MCVSLFAVVVAVVFCVLFSCDSLLFVFVYFVVRYNLCCFALLCFALRCLALFLSVLLYPLLCKGAVGQVTEAQNQKQKL